MNFAAVLNYEYKGFSPFTVIYTFQLVVVFTEAESQHFVILLYKGS